MYFSPKVNEFIETCKKVLLPSIHPVGVIQQNSEDDAFVRCAGSALLLENDDNSLFITNNHVAEALLNHDKASAWVQIGDLSFDPGSRLIFNDPSLDVAGFSLEKSEIDIIGLGARLWPASQKDDAKQTKMYPEVILYGFPGIFRVRKGTTTEAQGILHGLSVIDVSASGRLILKFDPDEFITPMSQKDAALYAKEPGGISGAPVFGWNNGTSFVWIGTVVELGSSLEILHVVPSRQIFDFIGGNSY